MEDEYFYIIPSNYFSNNETEELEIKSKFIEILHSNGVNVGKLNKEQLNGICGDNEGLTSNLKTQTSDFLLYVKCGQDIVAAVTFKLDFLTGDMEFEEENEENEEMDIPKIPWEISRILIQTLCSKKRGYGRKIIEKIKHILYSCADDGLGEAVIQLDYTRESKGFYEKLNFNCKNEKCILNITFGGTKHKLKRKIRKKTKKFIFRLKKKFPLLI